MKQGSAFPSTCAFQQFDDDLARDVGVSIGGLHVLEDLKTVHQALERCAWPDLTEPYAAALREAVSFILSRFDPMGILVSGTIVRGRYDRSSDLDISVLHRDMVRQRLQKRFQGVPAEIFVNPPAAIERYFADDQQSGRPITAHMWATGFVVYAADPIVNVLREQAEHWLRQGPAYSPAALTRARYFAATFYEDAVDVAERDPDTASMLLSEAVFAMLQFFFRKEQRSIPRYKDLLDTMQAENAELGSLARSFFTASAFSARLELATQIADATIGERGFFEWESAPETVKDV